MIRWIGWNKKNCFWSGNFGRGNPTPYPRPKSAEAEKATQPRDNDLHWLNKNGVGKVWDGVQARLLQDRQGKNHHRSSLDLISPENKRSDRDCWKAQHHSREIDCRSGSLEFPQWVLEREILRRKANPVKPTQDIQRLCSKQTDDTGQQYSELLDLYFQTLKIKWQIQQ